ncbi:acyltransferase [Corynebacterium sp. CNCTC7651]|uniref:acyltransferase family protein n=1 Tax=Corynebacterium sp. CNCTC7651 TaxID=2815361 RepID=UPI001F429332|nr:acyltransferase family protein [Corynebacterium sp. CNCTC7651]UIZ91509.1 acyltransferase [Corynebacterium sp. CNCTC7651]
MSTPRAYQPARPSGASAYRVDLDGLRGYAIALVVIFHVFVGRVSGGVDVFLFLSGYFFLGGQLRYAMRPFPNLNPWWPFWRTVRRLVPALVVVLAATLLGILALTPELMNEGLARQFTASLLYFQNWELTIQDAAYAAASDTTSPLQHLWSMSVQGQFYIFGICLATLIAWLVSTSKTSKQSAQRLVVAVLAVITVASFAYAARFGFEGTPQNYYSTFSRAWELSLGALLAFVPAHWYLPQRGSWIASLTGLVMITATGIIIPTSLAFPGPLALLPITGAALIILAGNANPVSTVLASKPMTWLGSVAYPLYLWHWPLLIIVTASGGFTTPPPAVGVAVILASLALAHVTYTLVEKPLRQHGKRPLSFDTPVADARASLRTAAGAGRAVGGAIVAALFVCGLAIQPVWDNRINQADKPLDPAKYPGAMALLGTDVPKNKPKPNPQLISGIYPPIGLQECMIFLPAPADEMPRPDCAFGDLNAETTVVMVGGSHIEPFGIPLDILGQQHGFKVIPFVRQECPLVIGGEDRFDIVSEVCAEWGERVYQQILDIQPDLVISTSTRPGGRAGAAGSAADAVPDAYANLWANFADQGIPFLGLRDNPWFFDPFGNPMDPNVCIVAGGTEESCSMPAAKAYPEPDPAAGYLDGMNNLFSVDTAGWYCPGDTCPPQIGNVYVYRDQNHISNAYARSLTPLLWGELVKVFDQLAVVYTP